MKLTKEQTEQIIELVSSYMDYEVEPCGYQEYDINGYVETKYTKQVQREILELINQQGGLAKMFDLQVQFQKLLGSNVRTNEFARLMFIGLITESCEALEELNWKTWKQPKPVDIEKYRGEIIDIWHFLINLTLSSGMTADDVVKRFIGKNKINTRRQKEKY